MGKNWKGRDGGGRGGRGGGGRGGGGGGNDLSSCRGYAGIIGTCDAARERESTKELSNLLNQAIERLGLTAPNPIPEDNEDPNSTRGSESIEDMLRNEVMQVKKQRHSGTQDFISINTGIKGIVLVKISRRDICPVMLVKSVFDQVSEEKVPISRHLVKLIPLQLIFFAGEEEFGNIAKLLVEGTFTNPGVTLPTLLLSKVVHNKRKAPEDGERGEDNGDAKENAEDEDGAKRARTESKLEAEDGDGAGSVPPVTASDPPSLVAEVAPTPEVVPAPTTAPVSTVPHELIKYMVLFKARNHNTLTKTFVLQKFRETVPAYLRQDYLLAKNVVIVEALKNIGGISYFPDFFSYADLNLRKHQAAVCPQSTSSHIVTAAASAAEHTVEDAGDEEVTEAEASPVVEATVEEE